MAADERVVVEVKDKIDPSIRVKIEDIGKAADESDSAVERLKATLAAMGGSSVGTVKREFDALQTSMGKVAVGQERLATSSVKAAKSEAQLSAAAARATTAQNAAAISAARLTQAESRTAQAASQAASAQDRAALTALRLASAQDKASKATENTTGFLEKYRTQLLGIAGVATAGAVINLADSYQMMRNKLVTLNGDMAATAPLLDQIKDVANSTYAPVEATAQAYSRFARAVVANGGTLQDAIPLTTTINKLLRAAGAGANEAGAALLQLSQAFNKGKLDGDEFRTVMELMPTAADAIAKQLGVTRGELLKLAPEGVITTQVMMKAFEEAGKTIDQSVGAVIPTVADSLTILKNELQVFLGKTGEATGVMKAFSGMIILVAKNLDSLVVILAILAARFVATQIASWAATAAFGGVAGSASVATRAVGLFNAVLLANPITAVITVIALLITNLSSLESAFDSAIKWVDRFWDSFDDRKAEAALEQVRKIEEIMKRNEARGKRSSQDAAERASERLAFEAEILDFQKRGLQYGEAQSQSRDMLNPYWNDLLKRAEYEEGLKKNFKGTRLMVPEPDKDLKKEKKDAENRALALARVNRELDNEISRQRTLSDIRDKQARYDSIEESLAGRKIQLTEAESRTIREKVDAIADYSRIQGEQDRIYESAMAPARDYNATIKASEFLLTQGAISQARYNQEIAKAELDYQQATDVSYEYNKSLERRIELQKYSERDREIEAAVLERRIALQEKGLDLSYEEAATMKSQLRTARDIDELNAAKDLIRSSTTGAQRAFDVRAQAFEGAGGENKSLQATQRLALANEAGVEMTGTEPWLDSLVEQREEAYRRIDVMRQRDLINEQTASAMKLRAWQTEQNAKLDIAKGFFSNFEGMQRSSWSEMAAIGKAGAIANATITTYQAANAAYAAMAGIPVVGPALGAAAAAAAIASGIANVEQIASTGTGFKQGGYTGNGGTSDVAGVVHGREYVFDAASTARLGRHNLDSLRAGDASGVSEEANGGGGGVTTLNLSIAVVSTQADAEAYLASRDGEKAIVDIVGKNSKSLSKQFKSAS